MADILAVDDERDWQELYVEQLAARGHAVRIAGDGAAAIEEIERQLPDLVILDLRMSPSGRQMLWYIRRYWPGLPVIIHSAYGGYRTDPDFATADAFLEKSPDPDELARTIEEILGRRRGVRQQIEA